jgi:hypothetical protein
MSLLIFLIWGIDPGWRQAVIRTESRWLMECLGTRAFTLGMEMDRALQSLLGPLRVQSPDSIGEGWVMGLRQVMTRLFVQGFTFPLLALGTLGFLVEARCLRRLRSSRFSYTSPLQFRRLQHLFSISLMGSLWILLAPFPVHPLLLLGSLMIAAGTASACYAANMKQI